MKGVARTEPMSSDPVRRDRRLPPTTTATSRDLVSIVIPLYNEVETLPELIRRTTDMLKTLESERAEVLLVDDGSDDGSAPLIRRAVSDDSRFVGVLLSRNFGQQAAISTGLELARGDFVVILDGDLQDPPELIPDLLREVQRGTDVAYAVREKRKEPFLKKAAYSLFYRLLRATASVEIPLDSGDFCCMRRTVVDAMLALPEKVRFVRGIRAWVGYQHTAVPFERAERFAGKAKYTLPKLIALAYDGLFSFTRLPIRALQVLGFITSLAAFVVAVAYFAWFLFAPERFPAGFATLVVSVWLLAGTQLLFLGIVAEYVIRAYEEARSRPVALVREVIRSSKDSA